MKKRIFNIVILSLIGLFIISGCTVKEDDFKVGLEAGYAPFNWTQLDDSNGAVPIEGSKEFAGGYDVEIAKRIAQGLGKELVVVKTDWDGLLPSVNSGIVDAYVSERPEGISAQAANDNFLMIELEDGFKASDDDVAVAVGLKKGSQLTEKINEVLNTISEEERQEIMDDAIRNQPASQE